MAEKLKECCQAAKMEYVLRLLKAVMSYPVIKSIPCPVCRHVIPIRVYGPPESFEDNVS